MRTSFGWATLVPQNRGVIWYCFFDMYYLSYIVIAIMFIYYWGKKAKLRREVKQSKIIFISMIITCLIGTITDVILPHFKFKVMPQFTIVSILVAVVGVWYSITKYSLMGYTSEGILIDVLKIMHEGLIILNEDECIISANNGALELLGYMEMEIKNKPITLIFSDIEGMSILNSNSNSFEVNIRTKNNKKIPVLISTSVLIDKCFEKYGTVLIFHNIFEIKQIQNKLKDINDNLEKRVQERTHELNNVNMQLAKQIYEGIDKEERNY